MIYIYIYIYIYTQTYIQVLDRLHSPGRLVPEPGGGQRRSGSYNTPSRPIKSFPTKSPRVKLSQRLPIKFNGRENSHP